MYSKYEEAAFFSPSLLNSIVNGAPMAEVKITSLGARFSRCWDSAISGSYRVSGNWWP